MSFHRYLHCKIFKSSSTFVHKNIIMFFRFYFLKENNIFVSSFAGEKLCKCNEKKAEQINELIPMVQWYHHRVFVKVEPLQCHPQILIWNLKRTLQSLPNLLPLWLGWMWYLKMMPLVINQWEMVEVFYVIIVFFFSWKDCSKYYFFFLIKMYVFD